MALKQNFNQRHGGRKWVTLGKVGDKHPTKRPLEFEAMREAVKSLDEKVQESETVQ